ncbi:putative amino acid transporter domain protein [Mycobacterium ulcerans str. Harvey]|uniref:Amino acid transporter domain protein n=1 Tax=Mycobacterium ulcerans str. Harvey TaxID=1299332 RepID=A0ABN0QUF5_MYCUL|nr:putative amino acid transporter domain protein [Mycobacterium ulcerans str. Harvey]
MLVCWYYGITAFACMWYFRKELFTSLRNVVFKFLCPLLGGMMLLLVFIVSVRESMDPRHGSGASIAGVGLVFYLGFGILSTRCGADGGHASAPTRFLFGSHADAVNPCPHRRRRHRHR